MQVFNFVSYLLFLIISCTHLTTATVTLTADYTGNICTNTIAVFTCVTNTDRLFWLSGSENHLFRLNHNSPNETSIVGDFNVKLISSSNNNMISTATTNATTNGISITCRDDISGGNSASKTIELASAPSKPLNFINTTTTFNSVSLSWSPPSSTGGTNLDHYIIIVDPLPETGVCPDNQCRVISNDTILTDLLYGTTYNVTIKAVNCAGSGPIETLSLTIVGQEPFPPQNLEVCVHGNNGNHELRVSWMCSDLFSLLVPPITNYEIALSSSNTLPTRINVLASSNCNCSYSIDIPVEAMSLYSMSVLANNSVGSSINNPMVTVFTSANLTTTTVIQTATSAVVAVNISWQSCIGSQAMLQLNYTHNTWSKMETFTATLPAQITYIPLTGLQSGTSYDLSVDLLTNGITVGSLTGNSFMTERLDNIAPAECSSIVSRQTITVPTIITKTMIITPSIEPNVDSQCANNSDYVVGISILGIIAAIAVISAIVLLVCLFCINKNCNKRRHYSMDRTTGEYINTTDLNSSKTHLIQSKVFDDASLQVKANQSYGQFRNNEAMNSTTEHYAQPYTGLPIVTTNPTYVQTTNNTSQPTPDEITTDPVYLTSYENGNPVYVAPSEGTPSPFNSPLPTTKAIDNPAYAKPYMVVSDSSNIERPHSYITPVPIYEKISEKKRIV